MKRLAIVLLIIATLGTFSPFHTLAQPTKVPHENPAIAKESLDTTALLLSYGTAFDLIAAKSYSDAQDRLTELKTAHVPDELRYIADRYNALSQQLSSTLNNLDSLLSEASNLLAQNQLGDAKERLGDAELAVQDTNFLLEDIESAISALVNKLGVFAAAAPSQARQAYERLEVSLNRSRLLTNEFNQLRQNLSERRNAQTIELMPTELNLSVNPTSVFVGNSITASGKLTGDGSPLPQRKLAILLDKEPLSLITTNYAGSYKVNLAVPYKYVSDMTLTAEYVPSGEDTGIYQGCKSRSVPVMFYPTRLDTSAPQAAHPGLPIGISGQVSPIDGITARTIKVLLDDFPLAEKTIRSQFDFELEATPPPQTSIGIHNLTVMVTPQGRFSGASSNLTIQVSELPIQTVIQSPLIVIMPKPIQVSGKVYYNLSPVHDASISVNFKDSSSTVRTSADGSFAASLKVPFALSTAGTQELAISIRPVEVWYDSLEIKRQVFAINPANTGLMLAILMSLGLVIYRRSRARPQEEKPPSQTLRGELLPITVMPEPGHEFSGAKGRILSAYISSLMAIQKAANTAAAPHTTLREFLETITSLLPTVNKPFAELTTITEVTLYSAHKLNEEIAIKAEKLAISIEKELEGGTS